MRRYSLLLLALVVALCAAGVRAHASPVEPAAPTTATDPAVVHEPGQSYLYLRVYDDSMVVRVEMALGDANRALGTSWDPDTVREYDLTAETDRIRAYLEPRVELWTAGTPIPWEFQGIGLLDLDPARYVTATYLIDQLETIPDEIEVLFTVLFEVDSDHRNMLIIEHNWKTSTFNNEAGVSLIFSPRNPRQTLDLSSSTVLRGFIGFIWLGVWHILIGFDHILFLLALVLPSVLQRRDGEWVPVPSFRKGLLQIVVIVSFFTIAHSVTLSLAALDVVRLPSRLVESIIAGSIAIAALAALLPKLSTREWLIAFVFGLFHGFGFATVLGDIGMGREYMVLSLLGFNIGVELGQIAIITLVFPVLFVLRDKPIYDWIRRIGAGLLIAIALYWFLERSLDIDIPLVPPPLRGLVSAILGG